MNHTTTWVPRVTALALTACIAGCFPTKENSSGNGDSNPQDISQQLVDNDSPQDLPTDIASGADVSETGIDSMFNLLIERVESLDDADDQYDVYNTDFESLRKGFGAAIVANSNHPKANIGFIVSSVLALNGNPQIQKMVDSLDAYIQAVDDYYWVEPTDPMYKRTQTKKTGGSSLGLIGKVMARQGILPAGQALVSQTPRLLKSQTMKPSFPRFVTATYVQGIIEQAVVPRLNEVIAASGRLRAQSALNLVIPMFDDSAEIDVGDMYLFEAGVRAARAGFAFMCIYDMSIHSPDGSKDMRWIDSYIDGIKSFDETVTDKEIFRLSNDTLYRTSYYDASGYAEDLCEVYQYNFQRSGFMSIQKNYFDAVYSDLKQVPELIKTGIATIRSETDNQDLDLIASSDIMDLDAELVDLKDEMIEEGISAGLAGKFSTPEHLMDFISSLLVSSYTFDETIDGKSISLTVDLSKFFTNPPNPLTEYWPKHVFPQGNDRFLSYVPYEWIDNSSSRTFYYWPENYDEVILDIPASAISSIDSSSGYSHRITLVKPYTAKVERDSMKTVMPIIMVDDAGKSLDYSVLYNIGESVENLNMAFPYFVDYTFGGIFPEMTTRQKWITLFSNLYD